MIEGLWVFGHGNRDDSLGVCIRYVLSRFTMGASQSWVDGMTGMAFSLPLLAREDCTAWWMEGWNDINLHAAMSSLGLRLETVRIASEKSNDLYLARPKNHWSMIKEKIKDGFVVIENTWPLSTVIDSWDDEIDRPERVCFNGFPLYPNPEGQFHIISRSTNISDREQSVKFAIEFGLGLLDGKHDNDYVKYGNSIQEAIRFCLNREFFCNSCKDEDFSCFTRTLSRLRGQKLSLMWFAKETKGIAGQHTKKMQTLAEDAENVANGIRLMLDNPDLEKMWKDKQAILEKLPF